jgi:DNA polymerase sigma
MKIEIEEEKLYEFIRRAVKEAFEEYGSVVPGDDDIEARNEAMEELERGETKNWDDYKTARVGS